ncbi:MAG: hypothetical protein LH631_02940 [Alkalinema sp. CAN_BIN05]|nr:hypothetical protein [Alkalinema sp. CAN_BIN05]
MLIDIAQTLLQSPIDVTHLAQIPHFDLFQILHTTDTELLGQINTKIKETDLVGDVSKSWQHVVKTGQIWAFLIGATVGYMAKTFTTYG